MNGYIDEINNIAERIEDLAKQTGFLLGEARRVLEDAKGSFDTLEAERDEAELRTGELEDLCERIAGVLNAEGF